MRETTLLEVMAEVGAVARALDVSAENSKMRIAGLIGYADAALYQSGDRRRQALKYAAALAILALHAHDAEAANAPDYNPGPEGA